MGNFDNWTTPKATKIAREGDPRGTRRGVLKKGERRKGPKARLDELKSAHQRLQQQIEWTERAPQSDDKWWNQFRESSLKAAQQRFDKIRAAMVRDGVNTGTL